MTCPFCDSIIKIKERESRYVATCRNCSGYMHISKMAMRGLITRDENVGEKTTQ